MKRIIVGLFLASTCIIGVGEAYAQCTCARPDLTAFEELKDSEAVFIGEVISKEIIEKAAGYGDRQDVYDMEIKFKVKKVWRKNLRELVTVRFLVYGCIKSFDKGSEYVVYAFNDNKGQLRTGCCCSRTRPLAKAAEDLKEFEERGEKPKQVITTPSPES
jgi:hypothetical protein